MKTFTFILLLTVASFGFGFAYKTIIVNQNKNASNMKKVTGIGGIFFKCKDPKKMTEWYQNHLGLNTKKAQTQWTPFAETTKYFEPSTKDFMINYRVENLTELVSQLKNEGVTILDNIETYDYGKFVHILDAEGNKIQLWEPTGE